MANLTRFEPFDDLFRGFFVRPVEFNGGTPQQLPPIRMDVREQGDCYLVHAELPGARKEDIHVTVDGNQVAISAEIHRENDAREGEQILRSERYYGKVARSFQLEHDLDDSRAHARYTDGILELTLPKRVAAPSKRLNIQ